MGIIKLQFLIDNHETIALAISFFAIFIASLAMIISFFSHRVAKQKLRLDLHNKRFDVYCRILNYANLFLTEQMQKIQDSDIRYNFILAFRESKFLFKPNSGIYKIIEDILQTCGDILFYYESKDKFEFKNDKYEQILTKKLSIEGKLINLENAMLPYLKFSIT